jgi:hypothetical protein
MGQRTDQPALRVVKLFAVHVRCEVAARLRAQPLVVVRALRLQ